MVLIIFLALRVRRWVIDTAARADERLDTAETALVTMQETLTESLESHGTTLVKMESTLERMESVLVGSPARPPLRNGVRSGLPFSVVDETR